MNISINTETEPVCIVDFGGSCHFLGESVINYWAFYFPEKGLVRFGGFWHTVPDMLANKEPSEAEVYAWVEKYPSALEKRIAAEKRKRAKDKLRREELEKRQEKQGMSVATAILIKPDGTEEVIKGPVGTRKILEVLQSIGYHLTDKTSKYAGYKLKKLTLAASRKNCGKG